MMASPSQAGGISYEDDLIDKICERMEGKQAGGCRAAAFRISSPSFVQAHELIAEGFGKFAACGGGGGGGGSDCAQLRTPVTRRWYDSKPGNQRCR